MTASIIRGIIEQALKKIEHLKVKNNSAEHFGHVGYDQNSHFRIEIISEEFAQFTRIERHKMLFKILDKTIKSSRIHAISLSLLTKDEHNKLNPINGIKEI